MPTAAVKALYCTQCAPVTGTRRIECSPLRAWHKASTSLKSSLMCQCHSKRDARKWSQGRADQLWHGISTCIAEDPRGNVGTRAHDVFHVQAGLQPSLAPALVPNNLVDLGVVGKAAAKELHELSQVSLVEVLFQELGGTRRDTKISFPTWKVGSACV